MNLHKFTSRQNGLRSGFTLVELLTVIAIIGILAAILIPVTNKVRENARGVRCQTNLREIGKAMFLHAAENKNRFPVQTVVQVADPLLPSTAADSWIRAVSRHLSVQSQTQLNHALSCPNVTQEQSDLLQFSYAMNRLLAGRLTSSPVNPSKTILIRHTGQSRSSFAVDADNQLSATGLNYSDSSGKYNYLFSDGHVAMHTPLLPYNPNWYVAP
jgi:prepilin-type N-terminal cleavage/methylation domain-containing protein/prepilin-type processing-associated H-X9-DG protein